MRPAPEATVLNGAKTLRTMFTRSSPCRSAHVPPSLISLRQLRGVMHSTRFLPLKTAARSALGYTKTIWYWYSAIAEANTSGPPCVHHSPSGTRALLTRLFSLSMGDTVRNSSASAKTEACRYVAEASSIAPPATRVRQWRTFLGWRQLLKGRRCGKRQW